MLVFIHELGANSGPNFRFLQRGDNKGKMRMDLGGGERDDEIRPFLLEEKTEFELDFLVRIPLVFLVSNPSLAINSLKIKPSFDRSLPRHTLPYHQLFSILFCFHLFIQIHF